MTRRTIRPRTPVTDDVAWGARLPPGLSARAGGPADRAFLLALYAAGRSAERRLSGWPDAVWNAFITRQFDLRAEHYRHLRPAARDFILLAAAPPGAPAWAAPGPADRGGSRPIGVVTLDLDRDADGGAVRGRIVDLAFLPEMCGCGHGTGLIGALARAGRRRGFASLDLSVAATNGGAERLYRRLGFLPQAAATAGGGADPATPAYLAMRLELTGRPGD